MNQDITQALGSVNSEVELIIEQVIELITSYGLNVLGALVILVIGLKVAGWSGRATEKTLNKLKRVDPTLIGFFSSLVRYAVMTFVLIAVLNQFGVQTTSLIAVLGAAGLAIGLALQGTLSNVAAGVMLLIFRPYKVGDFVEAGGHAGTIKELNLFFSVMAKVDNVRIAVPNSQIWGNSITNYAANPTRRVDFLFGVSYDADLDVALAAIRDTLAADARVHSDPEILVAVSELADSSVNIVARAWTDTTNYWAVKWDMTKAVKEALDAKGVGIPFPTRTVHMIQG